jgi:hypothetical protein
MRKYFLVLGALAGCGGGDGGPDAITFATCDDPPGAFDAGDPSGHPRPLEAGPGHARAGRLTAADLDLAGGPAELTWQPGDFVLANDRVAIVIEDAGASDLYDPWGGKPVGLARVSGGVMIEPADFGENFYLVGRSTLLTTAVGVLADGADGGAAVVRATGRLAPLPFLASLLGALYFDALTDVEAAIDYVLEPGADVVDVYLRLASPRARALPTGPVLHGFMYTPRMPTAVPGNGFTGRIDGASWVMLVDDDATSWSYHTPGERLNGSIAEAGFVGAFTGQYDLAGCGTTDHHHARIAIGGPGLDGLEVARARIEGRAVRAITGTVGDGVEALGDFHVHAVGADGRYLTRATTDAAGAFTLHVPADAAVTLTAYRRGWATATAEVAAGESDAALVVPRSGWIRVRAVDDAGGLPVRVQVLPAGTSTIPAVPDNFGEDRATGGRLHVAFPPDGDVTLPVPEGSWQVVVSRGYEYEVVTTTEGVTAGATTEVAATLERVVDTDGVQCGDFHLHTRRSNDARDSAEHMLLSAAADGVELPVRSEHEWVATFQPHIEELGLDRWAFGIGSIEMTSFVQWGHMGVFPLDPDPDKPNAGAPMWQTWPTPASPDAPVTTLSPVEVFDAVRARPERPAVIINHPRGGTNYFTYVGFDPVTGLVSRAADWDNQFTLVEVFNDADWRRERDRVVADWFALLDAGRRVFAIGSSDSHGVRSSPAGYPRTCIDVGTDDPRALTADLVRDRLVAGHATVSGGIYVDAAIGAAGPGDTATGAGARAQVAVRVQAATWIDVDELEVVVDGRTIRTIPVTPQDADPNNPVIRWQGELEIDVAAGGSWVVVAAQGDAALEPVHPGRTPFGVTNPIWVTR